MYFLPLLIRSAFRFAGAIPALLRCASVNPLPVTVSCGVTQNASARTDTGVIRRVAGVFPGLTSILPALVSCVGQNRNFTVFYGFLCNPWRLIAGIHCYKLYLVLVRYCVIQLIPCYAVVYIARGYLNA